MPDGGVKVDTGWLRLCASDCDGTATAVRNELRPADDAVTKMRNAAPGWAFLGSLDQLSERWENLNKLLRDELSRAAEEFRFSASDYDGNENWVERKFHEIGDGWDEVLDYD
ncbi:hypothetical protein [Actinophytocola sp.]|uniref:hypothetical protein n=1 Tax=Actinophytocola sp. TaxID=1872138 RepID=UPI002ED31D23